MVSLVLYGVVLRLRVFYCLLCVIELLVFLLVWCAFASLFCADLFVACVCDCLVFWLGGCCVFLSVFVVCVSVRCCECVCVVCMCMVMCLCMCMVLCSCKFVVVACVCLCVVCLRLSCFVCVRMLVSCV